MNYTDTEIIKALESMGVPWHQHFVINSGLVGFNDSNGVLFVHIIENDELNKCTCEFLAKNGKVRHVKEQ